MLAQSRHKPQAKRLSEVTEALVAEAIDVVFAILSTVVGGILFALLLWSLGL